MSPRLFLVSLVAVARVAVADSSIPGEQPAPSADSAIERCAPHLTRALAELAAKHPFFSDGKVTIRRGVLRLDTLGPKKPWRAGGGYETYGATFQRVTAKAAGPGDWTGMRTWVSGGPPMVDFRRSARSFGAEYHGEGDTVDEFARVVKAELDRCLSAGDRAP